MAEVAGLALGGVSLLAGFAGAVDGYNLLRDVFASDNGLRAFAADWHVETVRFQRWGEHMRVDDGNGCLLHNESALVRGAIGIVFAEVFTLLHVTQPKLLQYGIKPKVYMPAISPPSDDAFKKAGTWIKALRDGRDNMKQLHRVHWAVRDKDELGNIVTQLARRNDQLWNLVKPTEADNVRNNTVMLQSIKSGQHNEASLLAVQQQVDQNPGSLLALSFRLKRLQSAGDNVAAKETNRITNEELSLIDSGPSGPGTTGFALSTYTPTTGPGVGIPRDVMIEWKKIEGYDADKDMLLKRIYALGAVLSVPATPEFCRLQCIGIFDDRLYEEKNKGSRCIGYVFDLPTKRRNRLPQLPATLASLLADAKTTKYTPPLGDRFRLAYRLASTLSLLHATGWLHKGLRADSILFAGEDITEPLIAGFRYSRPLSEASMEHWEWPSELTMYAHPQVVQGRHYEGWTKLTDIYSLGVVLWEIANWRPAFEERFRNMNAMQVRACLLEELEGHEGARWDGLVGRVYMDVVRRCMKGEFGVRNGDSEQEAKALGTRFFLDVIKELESCKA